MRRRRRRRTVCLSVVYRSPSSSTVVIQCCLLHAFSSLLSSLYNKCSSFNSSLGNIYVLPLTFSICVSVPIRSPCIRSYGHIRSHYQVTCSSTIQQEDSKTMALIFEPYYVRLLYITFSYQSFLACELSHWDNRYCEGMIRIPASMISL